MGVAGVDRFQLGHQGRVQVRRIGDLRLVQFHQQTRVDLRFGEDGPGYHDVIARISHDQFGLEGFIAFEGLVVDLDARLFLKIGHHILGDVIRPVVDIQYFFLRRCRCRGRCGSGCHRLLFFAASHQSGRQSAA